MKCRQIATIEIETDDENESFEKYIGNLTAHSEVTSRTLFQKATKTDIGGK